MTLTVLAVCVVSNPVLATDGSAIKLKTVTVEPLQSGANLVENPSFEQPEAGGIPAGWEWSRRNTDATCAIDAGVAHTGRQSLRLTNGTPFGAHVYGMLWRTKPIHLIEGKTYSMSAWVKSHAPGTVRLIGGAQWQQSAAVSDADGQWRRIWKTFAASAEDANFVLRISSESPTPEVWIDDVKVEEGTSPTIDAVDSQEGAAPVLCVDEEAGSIQGDGPFRLTFALSTPRTVTGSWNIAVSTGESLRQPVELAAGNWRVVVRGVSASASEAARTLTISLDESGHAGEPGRAPELGRQAMATQMPLQFYSTATALKRLDALKNQMPALQEDLQAIKARRADVSYPDATFTVLENFVGFAEEDARGSEVKRAFEQINELERMASRLRAELDAALAGRRAFAAVPRWTGEKRPIVKSSSFLAPVRLADGTIAERPVFFNGFGHFGRCVTDLEKWPRYGTNIIQIEFGPNRVFPADGQTSDLPMREMLAILDRAQKVGVAVCLLISPHYFPQWALAKWPHLDAKNAGFLKYCLHAAEGQELLRHFVATAIAPLKDHPALHSICLSNEPINQEAPCQPARELWQIWLQARHADLATLNARYQSTFASFADVPLPNPGQPPPQRAAWMDYIRFNQDFFAGWHARLAEAVHEVAPNLPVHAKAMTWTLLTSNDVHYGVDATLFGRFSDINGNDAVNFYNFGNGDFAQGWLMNAMGHDLQRSVRDAPVFNSENHIIADRDLRGVPAEHIRAALWQAAIHGQSATTVWVWERTSDRKSDLAGSIMLRPACTEAVGVANLDLNRAALEVTAIQQTRPQALILHGASALVWDSQAYDSCLEKTYTALSFTGLKLGFVTERQLEAGVVPEAPVLFLPGVQHISDAALAVLRQFKGRLVFTGDGAPLGHDEFGQARDPKLPIERLAWVEKTAARGLCEQIVAKLPAWTIEPLVHLHEANEPVVWGVEWRSAETKDGIVTNLCNYRKTPVTVTITRGNPDLAARDVLSGERVAGDVTLAPLEVRLIRLDRKY